MKKPKRARAQDVGADGVRLFTRTQAARFLGVTPEAVLQAQQRGALEAIVLSGVNVYTRAALELYRSSTVRGRTAAEAFRRFAAGQAPASIVVELELHPDVVSQLLEHYTRLTNSWLVAGPELGSREQWARIFGVVPTAAMVRRALEICARTPSLRPRLLEAEGGR